MAEHKDRVQQAADALEALGAGRAQGEPTEQPAVPDGEEASAPGSPAQAPAEPLPTSHVGTPPASPPPTKAGRPAVSSPVRVTIKSPGKPSPAGARPSPPAGTPQEPKNVEPPLAPLARVALARRIAFRRNVIPILVTTGLAMLLLGCWAVSVLVLGRVPFRPDAEVDISTRFFARVCLLAWPIGLTLLAGAAFLMTEVYRYYKGEGRKE